MKNFQKVLLFIILISGSACFSQVSTDTSSSAATKPLIISPPRGRTIVGIVLASEGALALPIGISMTAYSYSLGKNNENIIDALFISLYFIIGLALTIEGAATLTTGLILLGSTRDDWKEYKIQKTRLKPMSRFDTAPLISLTFEF
jgi:hypothetical protein